MAIAIFHYGVTKLFRFLASSCLGSSGCGVETSWLRRATRSAWNLFLFFGIFFWIWQSKYIAYPYGKNKKNIYIYVCMYVCMYVWKLNTYYFFYNTTSIVHFTSTTFQTSFKWWKLSQNAFKFKTPEFLGHFGAGKNQILNHHLFRFHFPVLVAIHYQNTRMIHDISWLPENLQQEFKTIC